MDRQHLLRHCAPKNDNLSGLGGFNIIFQRQLEYFKRTKNNNNAIVNTELMNNNVYSRPGLLSDLPVLWALLLLPFKKGGSFFNLKTISSTAAFDAAQTKTRKFPLFCLDYKRNVKSIVSMPANTTSELQ